MGRCDRAPVVRVGRSFVAEATVTRVEAAIAAGDEAALPDHVDFRAYREDGGYRLLERCHADDETAETIIAAIEESGLRGLGGAGFPTGMKWRFVRQAQGPRRMAVHADESEPGTFKDRHFLVTDPHRFIEGMLIGAFAVEAEAIYIYLRDEYPDVRRILEAELAMLGELALSLPEVHLRRGAGAYICGEESAMRGAAWFEAQGLDGHKGPRSYSVSGRVKEPGVKLVPAGITLNDLIEQHCGGMADGHSLKAFLPGGASGGIFPARMADLPLDFGSFEPHGGFIGSAAIIVLSDQDSVAEAALNLLRFFEDESCGQCTPCRVGTEKAVKLMTEAHWNREALEDLAGVMADASICGLGQAAANPLRSAMKYFPEELP
jgi:formate dehydrogenase